MSEAPGFYCFARYSYEQEGKLMPMSRGRFVQDHEERKKERLFFFHDARVLFGQIRRDAIYKLKIEQRMLFPPEEHPDRGPPKKRGHRSFVL